MLLALLAISQVAPVVWNLDYELTRERVVGGTLHFLDSRRVGLEEGSENYSFEWWATSSDKKGLLSFIHRNGKYTYGESRPIGEPHSYEGKYLYDKELQRNLLLGDLDQTRDIVTPNEIKPIAGISCVKFQQEYTVDVLKSHNRKVLWLPVDLKLRKRIGWLELARYEESNGRWFMTEDTVTTKVRLGLFP
jgi:hypothetical protein